jgi:hypothetical protein
VKKGLPTSDASMLGLFAYSDAAGEERLKRIYALLKSPQAKGIARALMVHFGLRKGRVPRAYKRSVDLLLAWRRANEAQREEACPTCHRKYRDGA